jgi:uncharacterized protein
LDANWSKGLGNLKILLAKIPKEGLNLNFSLNVEALTEGLRKGDELREFIKEDLNCSCHIDNLKDGLYITGEAVLKMNPVCFRCNSPYHRDYKASLNLSCIPDRPADGFKGKDYMDGDVGVNYFSGEEIDLGKIVREQVFLMLPMTYVCREDCKGLCPGCGADLNIGDCRCKDKRS